MFKRKARCAALATGIVLVLMCRVQAHAEWVAIDGCDVATLCSGGSSLPIPVSIGSAAGGQVGPDRYTGSCAATLGISTNFGQITYDVNGTAAGTSTGAAVAVGTTVNCVVYDTVAKDPVTGFPLKYPPTLSAGDPGSVAEVNGLVPVPLSAHPTSCEYGASSFSDGNTVPGNSCPPGVS
jgi:hypothetical protein